MIEILSQSAFASVQDLGRFSAYRWGVGTAGTMDRLALVCGNILLGNNEDAAGIEAQVFPFELRFEADHDFALTGADCAATLDGVPLLPWSSGAARAGQFLRLGLPKAGRWRGARAYLTLRGGIDVPVVLGSRSTQLRGAIGGLDGRMLRQGDRLAVGAATAAAVIAGVVPPGLGLPLEVDGLPGVRVMRAAEYDAFTEASLARFWGEPWKIGVDVLEKLPELAVDARGGRGCDALHAPGGQGRNELAPGHRHARHAEGADDIDGVLVGAAHRDAAEVVDALD